MRSPPARRMRANLLPLFLFFVFFWWRTVRELSRGRPCWTSQHCSACQIEFSIKPLPRFGSIALTHRYSPYEEAWPQFWEQKVKGVTFLQGFKISLYNSDSSTLYCLFSFFPYHRRWPALISLPSCLRRKKKIKRWTVLAQKWLNTHAGSCVLYSPCHQKKCSLFCFFF